MGISRIRQTKERSDKVRAKELSELKKENHRLKRELSRLKKLLKKECDKTESFISDEESSPEPVQPVDKKSDDCPQCGGSDLTTIKTPSKTITVCKNCKWRKAGQ